MVLYFVKEGRLFIVDLALVAFFSIQGFRLLDFPIFATLFNLIDLKR